MWPSLSSLEDINTISVLFFVIFPELDLSCRTFIGISTALDIHDGRACKATDRLGKVEAFGIDIMLDIVTSSGRRVRMEDSDNIRKWEAIRAIQSITSI